MGPADGSDIRVRTVVRVWSRCLPSTGGRHVVVALFSVEIHTNFSHAIGLLLDVQALRRASTKYSCLPAGKYISPYVSSLDTGFVISKQHEIRWRFFFVGREQSASTYVHGPILLFIQCKARESNGEI